MRTSFVALLLFTVGLQPAARPAPMHVEVADGVHVFISKAYGDVGLDGNSIAITSSEGVLVFDANGTPAASAAVLAGIRQLTSAPVRYVVNSHWHWDHWYGTETYRLAFPGVPVIAQTKTRALMAGPAIEFNRPGLERQLPDYIEALAKRAVSDPTVRPLLEEDRFFLEQKKAVHLVLPDVTYDRALDVHLGTRVVQVRNLGRAVTPGDSFVYLPDEKVLITGDLLVNPLAFALGCYPTEWLHVLEQLDALDASVIIPGHGEPLHDKQLLRDHIAVMRQLLERGKDAKSRGLDPWQAADEVMPRLHDIMVRMTHDDPKINEQFRTYLVGWYMHRVYDELSGPLTDQIAPIPPSPPRRK